MEIRKSVSTLMLLMCYLCHKESPKNKLMLEKKAYIATVMLTSNEIFCINEALKLKASFVMTIFFIGQGQHILESDNAVFIQLIYYFFKKFFNIYNNAKPAKYTVYAIYHKISITGKIESEPHLKTLSEWLNFPPNLFI